MKQFITCLALALFSVPAFAASAAPFDWPQWQGPDRNAVSKETGLLQEWPKDGPALVWKTRGIGSGYGGPSISAGRIFGISNRGDDEVVWARSEADGSETWVARIGPTVTDGMPQGKEGAGGTPTVDGDRLYVLGRGGALACLQVGDGKIVWLRSLTADFDGRIPSWKYNESPLIDGDKLICTPGGVEATVIALNKVTGETIWKSKVPDGAAQEPENAPERPRRGGAGGGGRRGGFGSGSGAGYASAIAVDFEGQHQYVQFTAKALVGISASDGELLWRYDRPANRMGINCSTPVYLNGSVFAASAYGGGGGMVKLSRNADGKITAEETWSTKEMENHHGGMIVADGALFGANGGNGGGYLICLDFQTGNVLWNERDPDKRRVRKGSVAMADGRIYYRTEEGTVVLMEPNRKEYVERGRFDQPDRTQQPAWTHPVIANGRLYIRDQDVLLCYDVKL